MRARGRRLLCALLGGHDVGRVPVWRDGRARLTCQFGCGWESKGIAVPPPAEAQQPDVRRYRYRLRRVK